MLAFIKFNFKKLFSFSYIPLLFLYLSFAWLLNDPNLSRANIFDSEKLTGSYDLILYSIMLITFLLFVINHFSREMGTERKAIIQTRLTNTQLFWGLVVVYFLFFIIGFVLPSYLTALLQQIIYAPQKINLQVFYLKILSGVFGFTFFWLILSLWLTVKFRDSFIVLVTFLVLFGISQIVVFISNSFTFDQFWLYKVFANNLNISKTLEIIAVWFIIMLFTIWAGNKLSAFVRNYEFISPFRNGLYSKFAELVKLELSKFHIQMLGLNNQKILFLFTLIGLFLVISVNNKPNANLFVLTKVYIGAFVPLLFSFNQYNLIQIDRDAGMIHNNFLRQTSYSKIVFNRWLILAVPQTLVIIFFALLLNLTKSSLPFSFVVYILLLSLSLSLLNLLFAVLNRKNNIANLVIFFFVYLQLRDDFQNFIFNNPLLEKFNIFQPLLQQNSNNILIWNWAAVIFILIFSLTLSQILLGKINYVSLEDS